MQYIFIPSAIQVCWHWAFRHNKIVSNNCNNNNNNNNSNNVTENSLVRHSQDSKEGVGQLKEKK